MLLKKESKTPVTEGQYRDRISGRHVGGRAVSAFFLSVGIAFLGYFIQQGAVKFAQIKQGPNFLRSKGFVSRRLKCDRAEWTLRFSGSGNDLAELVKVAIERREQTINFLRSQGIQAQHTNLGDSIINKHDRHSDFRKTKWNTELPKHRYDVSWSIIISTRDVDKVVASVSKFATFAEQFPTDGDLQLSQNVEYCLDNVEIYRAEMIAAAAASGRDIAQKIVGNSGTVGRLLNASQGDIRYSDYSKPYRDAELVSYFKFEVLPR